MMRRRLAVLAAVQIGKRSEGNENGTSLLPSSEDQSYHSGNARPNDVARFQTDLHGNVNVLLGGAILTGVIILLALSCYCCHKNARKPRSRVYSPYSRAEPDAHGLEIFTMDAAATNLHGQGASAVLPIAEVEVFASLSCRGSTNEIAAFSLQSCQLRGDAGNATIPVTTTLLQPPPPYESLSFSPSHILSLTNEKEEDAFADAKILDDGKVEKLKEKQNNDNELPSYEVAIRLEATGYV